MDFADDAVTSKAEGIGLYRDDPGGFFDDTFDDALCHRIGQFGQARVFGERGGGGLDRRLPTATGTHT